MRTVSAGRTGEGACPPQDTRSAYVFQWWTGAPACPRSIALVFLLLAAVSAYAAERWSDAYKRGVAAINAKSYDAGIEAMQRALAEMPSENTAVRYRNETIVYLPHYWIGVAKLNGGDLDGALREFRISEEQGAIQNTDYYARLRDWVARANAEKSRAAQSGVADLRKAADAAVSRAMSTQMDALAAGGDRSDSYRAGQRKLQEAMQQLKSGADAHSYHRATESADQARDLFTGAADEARKAKAARPAATPPKPQPAKPVIQAPVAPVDVAHIEVQTIRAKPQSQAPQPQPPAVVVAPPPATPVESEALVSARVALQQYRQRALTKHDKKGARDAAKLDERLRAHPDPATIQAVNDFITAKQEPIAAEKTGDLTPAFRAYARGEIEKSLSLLTAAISQKPTAEAFLLRGCAHYTAAVLSRKEPAAAAEDFKAALKLNRALKLDRQAFSPKVVAYFEQVRSSR